MAEEQLTPAAPAAPAPAAPKARGLDPAAIATGLVLALWATLLCALAPILDLAARLELPSSEPSARSVIIVIDAGGRLVGLLVDAVSDILTVAKDDIHNVPEGNSTDTELLNGIVTHESRMVGLIDLHAVVSGAKMDS